LSIYRQAKSLWNSFLWIWKFDRGFFC